MPGVPTIPVGDSYASGGIAYASSFVSTTPSWNSSGFSLFLGINSGNLGFGFAYNSGGWGCDPWWTLPQHTWCGSFGWVPTCGPRWWGSGWNSSWNGGWGWSAGWSNGWCGPNWSRPWHHPVAWGQPWCSPVAWPIACRPAFATCFGWSSWSSTFLFSSTSFVPPPPVVFVQPAQTIVVQQPLVITVSGAWSSLAAGSSASAMNDFSLLQQAEPWNREHDLGYALASAITGVDGSAAVALRRALDGGPEVLGFVPNDELLRHQLWLTVDRLRDALGRPAGQQFRRDSMLVLGAVLAILGDDAQAYFAIDQAIDSGERSAGAFGLKDLLRARLDGAI